MYFITLDTLPNKNKCIGGQRFLALKKKKKCLKLLPRRDSFPINRNGSLVLQWRVSSTSKHREKRLAVGQPLSGAASSMSPVAVPQLPICKIRLHRKICYTCGVEAAEVRRRKGSIAGSSQPRGRGSENSSSCEDASPGMSTPGGCHDPFL